MMLNDKFSENTSSVMCFTGGSGVTVTFKTHSQAEFSSFFSCPTEAKDSFVSQVHSYPLDWIKSITGMLHCYL